MNSSHDLASQLIQSFREPGAARQAGYATRSAPAPLGPAVVAPRAVQPRADLLSTLVRRRSERFYAPGPIPVSTIADVIEAGLGEDADAWPGEQPLETDVVAFQVDGLDPAIFSFDLGRRSFLPVAPLPPEQERERENLTLQAEFVRSAAIVSIAIDLEEADRSGGGHGYRMALGRVSAAAYTMWLDAVAAGLSGTVFAGFIPASVRRVLHCDGTSRHHVFALALGRAAPDQRKE